MDHDLISFVDAELPLDKIRSLPEPDPLPLDNEDNIQWPEKVSPAPIILITNPKDGRYSLLEKEPLKRIRKSSHIRFLIFSEHEPKDLRVSIFVDDRRHPFRAEYVGSKDLPLWVSSWEPNDFYDLETHSLRVEVTTQDGQKASSTVQFRVDEKKLEINGGFGEFIISAHVSSLVNFTNVYKHHFILLTQISSIFLQLRCLSLLGIVGMLFALLAPKLYLDYRRQKAEMNQPMSQSLQTTITLKIHLIDQAPSGGPVHFLQRQTLLWTLRFLRLPEENTLMWYAFFGFSLAMLTLPWFRAEFIPADTTENVRFGTFYLWGILFGDEWVPLADTWKFAVVQICFNVGAFLILFAWKATYSVDIHCRGSSKGRKSVRQLTEHAWFKGLEVLYWLWRVSDITALASFYGGVWPTLILNIIVLWLCFVGVMLALGLRNHRMQRVGHLVEGCVACQEAIQLRPTSIPEVAVEANPQPHVDRYRQQHFLDEHPLIPSSSSSSSSASSSSSSSSPSTSHRNKPSTKQD